MFSVAIMRRRIWFIALVQTIIVSTGLFLAWLLRFDFSLPYRTLLFFAAPILISIRLGMLRLFNLHRGWWHFSGINEAVNILKAVTAGTLIFWVVLTVLNLTSFPRSIFILEAVLTAGFLSVGRLFSRVLAERVCSGRSASRKVILIGAGFAAQMVIRQIERAGSGYEVLGCVDDDPSKQGIRIQGTSVIGRVDELGALLARIPADEVLIAIPSATGEQMQRFIMICQEAKVRFRTVPALHDLIDGQLTLRHVREVRIEDLLGRDPVETDLCLVRRELEDKVVLVTGAAGSIGSELCRQILDYGPVRLVCLDQNETGLFFLRSSLMARETGTQLEFQVVDICDARSMRALLSEFMPEIVFHAAAYKHVPMMESNVQEAAKNNVLGLLGLLDLADEAYCKSFVLISSDKAVNPTNVMGATKRIGELMLAARPAEKMRCVTVRFGNVLGSSGSVVPILQEQLRQGSALTITHPEIRRFFMTIQEAVSLVLQGFTIGHHGDILVLEMGTPIRILDMARTLIRLSGKSEESVQIRFTGLRDGEKLEEELYYPHEDVLATAVDKIKRINGSKPDWTRLSRQLEELRESMWTDGAAPIRDKLREIVPEYNRQSADPVRNDEIHASRASQQPVGSI